MKSKKKVALVYDRVNKWGGAERVLLALHEIFPDAPLYTSVYDKKNASWAKVFPYVKTSFLQKLPFAKNNHEFLAPLMPLAFESFDFSDFDLVVSVTSEAAKGIKTGPKTIHICYCLTPTRYLWSHYDEYFRGATLKVLSKNIVKFLKKWDKNAAKNPDAIIAISKAVKNRIQKYYKRSSIVIYPPVNISINPFIEKKRKYYLVVSRLVNYKKVDLVIKTMNILGYPLVIIGEGRQKRRLKSIAGENIKFAGKVSEKVLAKYYQHAKALVMPQVEDFGIVAVEAQSHGVPVVAYKSGGVLDTVLHGVTGVLFKDQSEESLMAAIKKFEKMNFLNSDLLNNAKHFSKKRFKKEFLDLVKKMLQ